MEALKETLGACGFEVDITSSASMQASLQRLRNQCNDEDIAQVGLSIRLTASGQLICRPAASACCLSTVVANLNMLHPLTMIFSSSGVHNDGDYSNAKCRICGCWSNRLLATLRLEYPHLHTFHQPDSAVCGRNGSSNPDGDARECSGQDI